MPRNRVRAGAGAGVAAGAGRDTGTARCSCGWCSGAGCTARGCAAHAATAPPPPLSHSCSSICCTVRRSGPRHSARRTKSLAPSDSRLGRCGMPPPRICASVAARQGS
eukprot:290324-Chlamydomonas_euryale.AAC.1